MRKISKTAITKALKDSKTYDAAMWIYTNFITTEDTLEGWLQNERDIKTTEDMESYIEKLKCIDMGDCYYQSEKRQVTVPKCDLSLRPELVGEHGEAIQSLGPYYYGEKQISRQIINVTVVSDIFKDMTLIDRVKLLTQKLSKYYSDYAVCFLPSTLEEYQNGK